MKAAAGTTDESRGLILRAALYAFSEMGFDGASTREIASRAGVNHGLITYYFGAKEKLWRAAVDLAFSAMESDFARLIDDPGLTDDQRARELIRAHVHFVAHNPEFVRLMHEEGKRQGPRMRWIVDRHVKPMYDAVVALLSDDGPLAGIPPVHFFYILAGASGVMFHQAAECRRLSETDPSDPAVIEAHAQAVELVLLGPR